MHDLTLKISLPTSKEDELPEINGSKRQEIFRDRASRVLKDRFGKDYWTLRMGRSPNDIELKISISKDRVEEFRAVIAELGFTEVKQTPEQLSDEDAGRA